MSERTPVDLRARLDALYREESGRILASLIRLLGDFDRAEDAMHDAFSAALEQWTVTGVPANPRAWLISTGRFKAIDAIRRQVRRELIAGVDGTTVPGLRALAGPVFNLQGQLVLVVSVIASQTFKTDEDPSVRGQLLNACREITHRLGGRWPETA